VLSAQIARLAAAEPDPRDALGVIRIAGPAAERAATDAGQRILVEIGLAKHDRTGGAAALPRWSHPSAACRRHDGDGAGCRSHVDSVVIVLYRDRDAMQRERSYAMLPAFRVSLPVRS
jgi:hypothetical protein